MKKILITLTLFFVACKFHFTPKNTNSDEENNHKEMQPNPVSAYDVNDIPLGSVEHYNKIYVEIRTSEGYLDMLQPNGKPFGKWNNGEGTPPNGQNWMFYITTDGGETYMIVPKGKTLPEKSTFVYATGLNDTNAKRYCIQSNKSVTLEPKGQPLYFYTGTPKNGYSFYLGSKIADSQDSYLQYQDGKLTSSVQAYKISTSGCKTNEDIGYPVATDGKFAVAGPIKLKRADGTPVAL